MEGLMAFPGVLLAIVVMAALGPSAENVVIAMSLVYTPRIARLVRAFLVLA
jgi:peptide/nickel transport system permease protein